MSDRETDRRENNTHDFTTIGARRKTLSSGRPSVLPQSEKGSRPLSIREKLSAKRKKERKKTFREREGEEERAEEIGKEYQEGTRKRERKTERQTEVQWERKRMKTE